MKKKLQSGSLVLIFLLFSQAVLPIVEVAAVEGQTGEMSQPKQEVQQNSNTQTSVLSESKTLNSEKTSETTTNNKKEEKIKQASEKKEKEKVEKATVPLQLLGVNDFHGALNTTGTAYLNGTVIKGAGTAANLSAHLNIANLSFKTKTNSDNTERIQAGDMVGASPANSALLQDEPTVKTFKHMNFTIGTLGNHEFDKGLAEFNRIMTGQAPVEGQFEEPLASVIGNYPREASGQKMIISNLENKTTGVHGQVGEIPFGYQPYVVKEYEKEGEKVKVGYIGVITSEFTNLVLAQHTKDFNVLDEAESISRYSKELRNQGVHAIVVVSHIGATSSGDQVGGDIVPILDKLDGLDPDHSVDVVFAAHNHQYTNGLYKGNKNEVRVVQATSQGKAYVDLQGELDAKTQDFVETPKAEIKGTAPGVATIDSNVQAIVDDASQRIENITTSTIGQLDASKLSEATDGKKMVSREVNEHNESPLGNLITDAQLQLANEEKLTDSTGKVIDVDFAMTNNGGIRADLLADTQGNVNWGQAQAVQPFGNILQVVALKGQDVVNVLNEQMKNGKTGYFLQVAGLSYTYTGKGETFKVKEVLDSSGKKLDKEATYHVVINDFLFGGGDGFKSFTKGQLVTAMDTDTNTFVAYFEKMKKAGKVIPVPKVNRKKIAEIKETNYVPVQLLGINDFHGAIDTSGSAYIEGIKHAGAGKAANLATHLNRAEAEFKEDEQSGVTERIQAGDLVGASPANSALLRDEPTIKIANAMNFTIGTLGNHEFDKGLGEFKRIMDGRQPTREELGQVSDNLWQAISNYPREKSKQEIVIANLENKTTGMQGKKGEIPFGYQPYTVKEYGQEDKKVKVGYIGVITKEFPNLVLAQHTKDFNVLDEATSIAKYTKILREKEKVNAIVVVSHIAATSNKEKVSGDIVPILTEVDKLDPKNSIDVVFTGHNHQFTNGVIERKDKSKVRVVQSTSQGKAYIDVQGELDLKTKDFKAIPKASVKPTTELPESEQDQVVKALVTEADTVILPLTTATVAKADLSTLTKDDKGNFVVSKNTNEHDESAIGNLITDAQLYMAQQTELKNSQGKVIKPDFAMTNNGGIRSDLLVAPDTGNITWGSVQQVQPFGNILQVVEMKGKDIKTVLEEQYSNGKTNYFLQVAGLTYHYEGSPEKGIKVTDLKDHNGKKVKENETFYIVINDFLFGGGDGFKSFTKGKLVTAMDTDTTTKPSSETTDTTTKPSSE
ncbi:bifunctional metallophosphatase/5'-nucleotidase, partial [Vagococcus sp.]|uniref:bifunctional metallophosphatase/5'-nucleotidase n=1 Tax=Vagococcus sp. TaxID=1933889 RepID=UPI003F960D01